MSIPASTPKPWLSDSDLTVYLGDALEVLRELPDASVDCCVTSPPYWQQRDYGAEGQLGLEKTPAEFVSNLVAVFAEVRRVLKDSGCAWLNIGDTYASAWSMPPNRRNIVGQPGLASDKRSERSDRLVQGLQEKELVGIPWMTAFALRADGWRIRSENIWWKPNSLPESVKDRPHRAHETIFQLVKAKTYYYDCDAVKVPAKWDRWGDQTVVKTQQGRGSFITPRGKNELPGDNRKVGFNERWNESIANGSAPQERHLRSVWPIPTTGFPDAHFAVMTSEVAEICIKASCPPGGVVLDPFGGAGTTALAARKFLCDSILIELSEANCHLIAERMAQMSLLSH